MPPMGVGGRRVVVTGVGLVSPIGVGSQQFWSALLERRSGIVRLSRFQADSYRCQVAGEIADSQFLPLLDPRKSRNTPRVAQLGLAATSLAMADAGWNDTAYLGERVGIAVGTALGGWIDGEKQFAVLLERGARRVNPFITNATPPNGAAGEIASLVGARGPQLTFASGCSAALLAIGDSTNRIALGELDAAFVCGIEAPLSPLVFAGMGRTMELTGHQGPPSQACRPFDASHDGMVLSEGACVLVLEDEDLATARGGTSLGRILGSGASCDAAGLFDLDMSGATGAVAVRQAMRHSSSQTIDYICAHGNGSPAFDRKEAAVIHRVFGDDAEIPVSSIKGALGHPFGAAGAFQLATALLAIRDQMAPPTTNLVEPDPECRLRHITGEPLRTSIAQVLVTSYGYGGVNGALLVGRS